MTVAAPRTAHSYAYEALRSRILTGELPPGAPLIQATLAKDLGVSMTPVREALRDLATEGLVTLLPHKGAAVTSLDLADAKEIHTIRLKLEPDTTRLAVEHVTLDVLNRAEALYSALSETADSRWVACNRDFHKLLLSSAPSPRLVGILSSLLEAAALYVPLAITHRVGPDPQLEHRAILDAYLRRDPEAAAQAVEAHIRSSIRSLEFDPDQPAGATHDPTRDGS
jgi:DNA-binding GntR family transcriptional regulator